MRINGARSTTGASVAHPRVKGGCLRAPHILGGYVRNGWAFVKYSDEPQVLEMRRTVPDHVSDCEPA